MKPKQEKKTQADIFSTFFHLDLNLTLTFFSFSLSMTHLLTLSLH